MLPQEQISTQPLVVPKTLRHDRIRGITSARAGKLIPLRAIPMLREDRVARGRMRIHVHMEETARTLMNAVTVKVMAHFVPMLAFEHRFNGIDQYNRSYQQIPENDNTPHIAHFHPGTFWPNSEFYRTLGLHAPEGEQINTTYLESYNVLWNWRARARSVKIEERGIFDRSLAPAFWDHPTMRHIVPDFDAAMIDGEVPLTVETSDMRVRGIGRWRTPGDASIMAPDNQNQYVWETGQNRAYPYAAQSWHDDYGDRIAVEVDALGRPQIFAEMEENGITVSLANIEMAKKTAAFAAMRRKYKGITDDYILDLLMEGIRVPDADMAQPILLDSKRTLVGYNKRYATDGDNLDQHVTTGETFVDLSFRTPSFNTVGVIWITAEVVPEQLFERQKDYFMYARHVDALPNFTRDALDPEKVAVVANNHVDTHHSDPDGTFGYAPLNHEWDRDIPTVGGKYYRQLGDPFIEDRQSVWAVEQTDPKLTEDFYVVGELPHTVFRDSNADPFEITMNGEVQIVGNTQFGPKLYENTDDYTELFDEIDLERLEGDGDEDGTQE